MPIGTIILIALFLGCLLILILTLRPPPLYGPPEKDEAEPPESQKPH